MVAQEGWLISGDWGTTTLRLRVVRAAPFQVVEEVVRPWGAASVHEEWEASSEDRVGYYLTRLFEAVEALSGSWDALPIYVSGMASSSVDIQELAYAPLPFDFREARAQRQQLALRQRVELLDPNDHRVIYLFLGTIGE